ncbi:MAG: hypothetical protein AAB444_00305 [Patescibacteria group bacterium]
MKHLKARFALVLLLLTLPLLGWGCTGGQTTPLVSEKSDTTQGDNNEPVPGDEKPAVKPTVKDDDQPASATAQSDLPEGWKWYENAEYRVNFGYPGTWHLAETAGADGFYVFLADKEIRMMPEPATPITLQITPDSLDQVRTELLRQDPHLVSDTVEVGGKRVGRIRYQSEVLGAMEYVYGLNGVLLWHIDDPAVQQIAMKLLATHTQGDAP